MNTVWRYFEDILFTADWCNLLPMKILGYKTLDDLFENELDKIYAVWVSKSVQLLIAIVNFQNCDVMITSHIYSINIYKWNCNSADSFVLSAFSFA